MKKKGLNSWGLDAFILMLIILNAIATILESVEPIKQSYQTEFYLFEFFSVIIFTIEYVIRLWNANHDPKYSQPIIGNLKYAATPMAIIDLLAFLPFYLPFVGIDLRVLRILRVLKIFRLFKIARYVGAIALIGNVLRQKKEELVVSVIFTLTLLLIASTLMYNIENEAQPDKFSSVPETMWWGIATLTTVGYGDMYPLTPMGKLTGGIIALIGIGLFAIPTGILASGFAEELNRKKQNSNCCQACGQSLNERTEDSVLMK